MHLSLGAVNSGPHRQAENSSCQKFLPCSACLHRNGDVKGPCELLNIEFVIAAIADA